MINWVYFLLLRNFSLGLPEGFFFLIYVSVRALALASERIIRDVIYQNLKQVHSTIFLAVLHKKKKTNKDLDKSAVEVH